MKLDKKTLDLLSSLPDDKLWQMMRLVSASAGAALPEKMPDAKKMAGLRAALSDVSEGDLDRAAELIGIYKGEKR